jgi:hypothetical protein
MRSYFQRNKKIIASSLVTGGVAAAAVCATPQSWLEPPVRAAVSAGSAFVTAGITAAVGACLARRRRHQELDALETEQLLTDETESPHMSDIEYSKLQGVDSASDLFSPSLGRGKGMLSLPPSALPTLARVDSIWSFDLPPSSINS